MNMAKQVKRTVSANCIKPLQLKNPKVKKSDFDNALRAMTKPRPKVKK